MDDGFANKEDLLEYLSFHSNELCFLVGEQLTRNDADGQSILGDEELLNALRKQYKTAEALARLNEAADRETDPLNGAFQHFLRTRDLDTLLNVVRTQVLRFRSNGPTTANAPELMAVSDLRMLQNEKDGWRLSPAIEALGRVLACASVIRPPIALTTCYDPLLYVSARRANVNPVIVALPSDGAFTGIDVPEGCIIVHVHGHWLQSEGLYTRTQRLRERVKLSASIGNLLSERTLVIIGIEPTETIVLRAIQHAADGDIARLKIAWAIRESAEEAKTKYSSVLEMLKNGVLRGRVVLYSGIDYDRFLPELASRLMLERGEVSTPKTDPVTAQIETVLHIAGGVPADQAVSMLAECHSRFETSLTLKDSVRLLARLASAYEATGNAVDASRTYERVAAISPDTLDAQAFEALASLHKSDYESVRLLCDRVLAVNPEHELAAAAHIHASDADEPVTEIEARLPAVLQSKPNIIYALGWYAFRALALSDSARFADKGMSVEGKGSRFVELRAASSLKRIELRQAKFWSPITDAERAEMSTAQNLLGNALGRRLDAHSRARVVYYQAEVAWKLGQLEDAEYNFRALFLPHAEFDLDYLERFAEFLIFRNRLSEAEDALNRHVGSSPQLSTALKFCELAERQGSPAAKCQRAAEMVTACLSTESATDPDLLLRALRWLITLNPGIAPQKIRDMASSLGPALQSALYCMALQKSVAVQDTLVAAKEAFAALTARATEMETLHAAEALAKTETEEGEELAASILIQALLAPCSVSFLLHAFSFMRGSSQDQLCAELCRRIRELGRDDQSTAENEIVSLIRLRAYDDALRLIDNVLRRYSDDATFTWRIRLRRSWLGIQLLRPHLIEADVQYLAGDEKYSNDLARVVCTVIRQSNPKAALDLLYRRFRRRPGDAEACRMLADEVEPDAKNIPFTAHVEVGSAVQLALPGGRMKWIVLESGDSPSDALDEYHCEHPIVVALLGKSRGEVCRLPYGQGTVECTIAQILSKYVLRRDQIWEDWELKHPGELYVRFLEMPRDKDGNPDLDAFMEQLGGRSDHAGDSLVHNEIMSPSLLAHRMRHDSVLEAYNLFIGTPGTPIRCCTVAEVMAASTKADGSLRNNYLVDPLGLAVILDSGVYHSLAPVVGRLAVTQATLDEYRYFLRQNDPPQMWIAKTANGHRVVKNDEESWKKARSVFAEFLAWIESAWTVLDCRSFPRPSAKIRTQLELAFNAGTTESILAAQATGRILWTDDYASATFAHVLLGVTREWTEFVLRQMAMEGDIPREAYDRVSGYFLRRGFEYMEFGPDTHLSVYLSAKWDVAAPEVRNGLRSLSTSRLTADRLAILAASILRGACREISGVAARRGFVSALISAIVASSAGYFALVELEMCVPVVFGLDVLGADLVTAEIHRVMGSRT